ncbi:MAG: DUF1080 domain-containing protein [Bryobacteraceae bacterium]|jgi:hypothetical protein
MKTERVLAICLLALATAWAQQPAAPQGAQQPAGQQPGGQQGGRGGRGGGGGQPRDIGPQPPVVTPGGPESAPSDAIVLFNGRDNTGWTRIDGTPSQCTVADGVMTCKTGALDTRSAATFHSAQIHVDFMVPSEPGFIGYAKANGGIILQGVYEIQLLDSYNNPVAPDSQCASLYRQSAPLVNACRPPEQWQSYDIVYHAPKCDASGAVTEPGSLTMWQNGVLVQDHVPVRGRRCIDQGPLVLQDHGRVVGRTIEIEEGPINGPAPETDYKYRNIWMRKLAD